MIRKKRALQFENRNAFVLASAIYEINMCLIIGKVFLIVNYIFLRHLNILLAKCYKSEKNVKMPCRFQIRAL